ncbi:MAG: MFS transporter [Gammaproteobacteria bacterium]
MSTEKSTTDAEYRYWRIRIFYSLYLGYVFFYITRKSFQFMSVDIQEMLHFSKQELGYIASALYIAYGISKFTSGILSDRSNPRYFLSIGLFLTGILNICFGLSSNLWLLAGIWFLNGWFQGWGWPPITKQLTHWFSKKERAFWWGVCSSSHNLGGWLASLLPLLLVSLAAYGGNWRNCMVISGLVAIGMSFFLLERLRGTPQSMGLPSIEEYKNDPEMPNEASLKKKGAIGFKEILFKCVLNNRYVWILGFVYFFVYLVRTAMNDWTLLFFVENKAYTKETAGLLVGHFEIGGFLGTLAAGYFSDKLFQGKRLPYSLWSCLGLMALIPFLIYLPQHIYWDSFIMGSIGFLVFGPQMLVGLAAAEFVDKRAAGTSNGFVGLFGYIGAACAGGPLGKMIDSYHWQGFFMLMAGAMLLAFLITLPILKPKKALSARLSTEAV